MWRKSCAWTGASAKPRLVVELQSTRLVREVALRQTVPVKEDSHPRTECSEPSCWGRVKLSRISPVKSIDPESMRQRERDTGSECVLESAWVGGGGGSEGGWLKGVGGHCKQE